MVDAEYPNTNPALTALAMALGLVCNRSKAIVWNTTQCYLKVRLLLATDIEFQNVD